MVVVVTIVALVVIVAFLAQQRRKALAPPRPITALKKAQDRLGRTFDPAWPLNGC